MHERLFTYMEKEGLDALFLCRPDNVAYLTGYDTPVSYGSTDNMVNGSFSYAMADLKNRRMTLIIADAFFDAARKSTFAHEVLSFGTFYFFSHIDYPHTLRAALAQAFSSLPASVRRIGVEPAAFPLCALEEMKRILPLAEAVDAYPALVPARLVKQPHEIDRLRRASQVEDAAQRRLLQYARDFHGETELEMFAGIYQAMCEEAGEKVNVVTDFATGPRIGALSGVVGPRARKTETGDPGILDISCRTNGYWCDCTNTVVFGASPTSEMKDAFLLVRSAFDLAVSMLKPGNTLKDVDSAVDAHFRRHGTKSFTYTGHQIGAHVNEPPRLVCYDPDTPLEPGMTICLEPQTYTGRVGVRLEKVVLVTENEAELLNDFPWGIED